MVLTWLYTVTRGIHRIYELFANGGMDEAQSEWVNLPDVALIEVYKFLRDSERAKMCLVCTNWARIFRTPSLWRTRHYDMCGHRSITTGHKASKFAVQFGQYLKYLSISCSHPSFHTCKSFQKAIEDLMSKLIVAQTQLFEFEMERLELDRFWKYDTPRERLISSFVKFFKTQKSLQCFDMSTGQFPVPGGCRILEAIGINSGNKVTDILIEDFFHSRLAVHQVKRYQKAVARFTSLTYVALNYNCISEEIVDIFAKSLKTLELLNIKVYRNDPHFHRITGFAWKSLHMANPGMRVSFWFESIGLSSEIIPILVKEAPVKDVHLWTGYDDDADWRLNNTLEHILDAYSSSLECLSLELDNNRELVDESLLRLVRRTKNLRELTVNAMILIRTVEDMCELQREEKINLKFLLVTCQDISDSDWKQGVAVRDHYSSLMLEYDLVFQLFRLQY